MGNILKFIIGAISIILIYLIVFNSFLIIKVIGILIIFIMDYYFGEMVINEWEKFRNKKITKV